MDRDETSELEQELDALRSRVVELSDTVADCRARGLHQESLITRLRQELRDERSRHPAAPGEA